jgi:anti-sigma factor ChrR (cupin superfamily)
MTDELEALQWRSVDELAAARRQAIRKLNLLDRSAADYLMAAAALERTMALIGQVQDGRRRQR